LLLDAFSSDAIPLHLLTREALREYRRSLRPDGLLLFHVSNRHFNLVPALTATAHAEGLPIRMAWNPDSKDPRVYPTRWLALGPGEAFRRHLEGLTDWAEPLPENPGVSPLSDRHSSLLSLLTPER
jgi:SAM-dependent methyltransferase